MTKTFVIQVEYPDNDIIPSEEVMEVTQECIEHYMELHFGANIMDGDYDRIKVKEVTDFASLVKRMRKKQWNADMLSGEEDIDFIDMVFVEQREAEREVDTWIRENYEHLLEE